MTEPINKISLRETHTETDATYLDAIIDEEGKLVLEGYDIGKSVKEIWGDSDYEYWLTISREYKDTVLLWLIKERFTSDVRFREWLDEKGIPNEFNSWV